jgi:hypothetical protein
MTLPPSLSSGEFDQPKSGRVLLVSSLPLSLTTIFGLLRSIITRSNSRARPTPQALARVVANGGQDAEKAALGELIPHIVEGAAGRLGGSCRADLGHHGRPYVRKVFVLLQLSGRRELQ